MRIYEITEDYYSDNPDVENPRLPDETVDGASIGDRVYVEYGPKKTQQWFGRILRFHRDGSVFVRSEKGAARRVGKNFWTHISSEKEYFKSRLVGRKPVPQKYSSGGLTVPQYPQ